MIMDSKYAFFFSVCTIYLGWFSFHVHAQNIIFSVEKFGGYADGKTNNSLAFSRAWKAACGTRGGVLSVPSWGTYLLGGATFEGPCIGTTSFQNLGTLKASPGPHEDDHWISFDQVNDLHILGNGTFDGNGPSAWPANKKSSTPKRPTSILISGGTSVTVQDVTSLNSKQFHFKIDGCQDVLVTNVKIVAPADSPNTDGIHVARSTGVKILNSRIATGDDCVSIGDGNEDINIEHVMCGPGHGISIGSLGKYKYEKDVRGVVVRNCNLTDTTNGLRIKTWAPSAVATTVYNVTFENINVKNVKNPIIINQYYCPESGCSHPEDSDIKIQLVSFINVRGTSASPTAVVLQCSRSTPCEGLLFEGLDLTTSVGGSTVAICSSADYKFMDPSDQIPKSCSSGGTVPGRLVEDDEI